MAMYWGREYWEIFLIAVVVVIVFGVIQVSLGLADREDHRAGRWISDLLSRAIIGALCALLLDLLASWIAPKYWGPHFVGCSRGWRSGRNAVPHPIKETPPVRKFKVRARQGQNFESMADLEPYSCLRQR